MQTTSDAAPPKRTGAKAKSDSPRPTVTVKKPRARNAAAGAEPVPPAVDEVVHVRQDAHHLDGMIATAAYFIAEERGFAPGHELDDWLEAERRIKIPG